GGVLGGVCAGLADFVGIDPVLVRVAVVVLSFSGGLGVLVYAVAWATVPVDDSPAGDRSAPGRLDLVDALAVGAVVIGLLMVLRSTGIWFSDHLVLPAVVLAV